MENKNGNELGRETSAYLLQHAHNPVHWKAWNTETLELAKRERKPLLISIGYAACHWCHVMEHETFEDAAAAALMNEHFICIKVDREERPDVDQVYMTAAQLINGNGGWPLNALALPDGKPFFAATYFPKKRWMEMLQYFIVQYRDNYDELSAQARQLAEGISEDNRVPHLSEAPDFALAEIVQAAEQLLTGVDKIHGGFAGNIKFPMPSAWEFLLEVYHLTKGKRFLEATLTTLNGIANGGIYDQLGGGFARYATDAQWLVPHFEKMLYDNAQLVSLYSHAFQLTKNNIYKTVVEQSIQFIETTLSCGTGYASSIDADSDGEEGAFYVWSYDEIKGLLDGDSTRFLEVFDVRRAGNFENGKNILHRKDAASWNDPAIDRMRQKLLAAREERKKPAIDDKIITAWNAMMSVAFTTAGCALNNPVYIEKSKALLDFILSSLLGPDLTLYRNFQNGKARTNAFLDDYAFLIQALIKYYQATFQFDYIEKAMALIEYVLTHFGNEENKMFYYDNDQFKGVFARPAEYSDNVIPSSNAIMAENLYLLGMLYHNDEWVGRAATMVKNLKQLSASSPGYYSQWLRLQARLAQPPFEVMFAGNNALELSSGFKEYYHPDCIVCGAVSEKQMVPALQHKVKNGQTLMYVCVGKSCQQPVGSVDEALKQIANYRKS